MSTACAPAGAVEADPAPVSLYARGPWDPASRSPGTTLTRSTGRTRSRCFATVRGPRRDGRLPRRELAGPAARATLERLGDVVESEWGGRLIRGWWEHWLELPVRVGDLVGELVGAAAGPGDRRRLDERMPLQACVRRARPRPGRSEIVVARDEFPTDRYVLEGLATSRGLELRWLDADPVDGPSTGARRRCSGRARRSSCSRTSTTGRRRSRPSRDRRRSSMTPERSCSGTCATAPARCRSSSTRPGRSRRRLYLQVPERRARGHRRSSTSDVTCRRSCSSRSGAGSAGATSSSWSRATSVLTA